MQPKTLNGETICAFALEEKFGLKIPDQALYDAKTVKDIVDYLDAQTNSQDKA